MIVSIHQPNYMPWIGYFRKIAKSDDFIFLDDVHFSKGSVTNRVKILDNDEVSWLTVPSKASLGTRIKDVVPSQSDWPKRHLSRLQNTYAKAACFDEVWPYVEKVYQNMSNGSLAKNNSYLIQSLCPMINIDIKFHLASDFPNTENLSSDDRLISLIEGISGATVYLSGSGGRKYQDEGKFEAKGIDVMYNDYEPVPYPQFGGEFVGGLSILDAAFNVGWHNVSKLVQG